MFVKIGILRRATARGKIAQTVEFVNNIVENGEKIIIFAFHNETINLLAEKLEGSLVINGSVSSERRQEIVDLYQNDENTKIIIGQIQAAGVGLTLTAGSNVIFIELPWTPSEQDQAEDRQFRQGQKKLVNVYVLAGRETIDERIYNTIERKRKIFNQVTQTEDSIETNFLKELIESYRK